MNPHSQALSREVAEHEELDRLIAEQRKDGGTASNPNTRQWPELRGMASLDAVQGADDTGAEFTLGDAVGFDERDAIDEAIDAGREVAHRPDATARPVLSGRDLRALRVLVDHRRRELLGEMEPGTPSDALEAPESPLSCPPPDRSSASETMYVHGTHSAPAHEYRSVKRDPRHPGWPTQLEQAYPKARRKPDSARAVPPILVRLFAAITTAVGAELALEASRRRGRPSPADRNARMLAALAVQAFREMGYTPSALAEALDLPPSTVSRYSNPELLPMLSAEAHARIFGDTVATSPSVFESTLDQTRARGRSDTRPRASTPNPQTQTTRQELIR